MLPCAFTRAVAFHNSNLSIEERRLVEHHFRTGDIRATFATSTLAMGMNFPVKNVILSGERWYHYKSYDTLRITEITKSEYENMSGRAGRFGRGEEFGRSLLIVPSPFHVPVKLRKYVESDFPDVMPTLANAPLADHVIDLLATGMARDADSLRMLLMSSFTGATYWTQKMSADQLDAMLTAAIGMCVDGGLAKMKASGNLRPTDLGLVCARKGIGVTTAVALARWADEARTASTLAPLEVLTVACLTAAAGAMHVEYPKGDRSRAGYRDELLSRALHGGIGARPLFEKIAFDQSCIEFETARAYKKALLLCDWIDEVKTGELERRYRVWAGAVRRLGEEFAWLVDAAAAIVSALGWADHRVTEVAVLAERLNFGMRPDALPIARLRVPGLGRQLVRRLVDAGVVDEATACTAERTDDLDARDRVLAALLRLARHEPIRELAGALLWLALWPGLCRVHRRARRLGASECEALSAIGFAFTALIESLDLARVNRVAATLVRNVERAVVAALRPSVGHEPHDEEALPALHRDPTEELAFTWRTLEALVDRDADLVLHVVVYEESHGEAARRLGIAPATARKRLQRALERARVRLAEEVAA